MECDSRRSFTSPRNSCFNLQLREYFSCLEIFIRHVQAFRFRWFETKQCGNLSIKILTLSGDTFTYLRPMRSRHYRWCECCYLRETRRKITLPFRDKWNEQGVSIAIQGQTCLTTNIHRTFGERRKLACSFSDTVDIENKVRLFCSELLKSTFGLLWQQLLISGIL